MSVIEVVIGLVAGTLVGASAMGSGSLVTPLLLLLTATPLPSAIGASLALATGTKLAGSLAHGRMGNVDVRFGSWLIAGALPGTAVALLLLRRLPATFMTAGQARQLVGGLLIALAVLSLWLPRRLSTGPLAGASERFLRAEAARPLPWRALLVGALVALAVTLTSVGGGGLLILALLLWQDRSGARGHARAQEDANGREQPPSSAVGPLVGTANFYGLAASMLGASAHLVLHNIDFSLLFRLALGSLPGVLLGARLTRMIPEPYYRSGIAALNLVMGLRLALSG